MTRTLCALLILAARAAGACPICFGATDTQAGFYKGLSLAIVALLVLVLSLIGGIGYAVWTVERARAARDA